LDSALLQGVRVLLVEDSYDTRESLRIWLKQNGADVTAVESASEALEALVPVRPHVLLSDIGLPGEDGLALIRKVRELSPAEGGRLPAAALTAYAREQDRAQALQAGFQAHVAKPIQPADLVDIVAGLAPRAGDR
jgi:CheY-like chemotaxis protein